MVEGRVSTPNIVRVFEYITATPCDSVEWCPNPPHRNTFVCGTYKLNPTTQTRTGHLNLFSLFNNFSEMRVQQVIECEGILDIKWRKGTLQNLSYLAVACSKSTIQIYKLNCINYDKELELVTSFQVGDEDEMLLSLDWSYERINYENSSILASTSKGKVHIFSFNTKDISLTFSAHAHMYEAWIAAYCYWDSTIFYTGGDDAMFCKFDIRCSDKPVFKSTVFKSGVTAIQSNKRRPHFIAVGGYDHQLYVWDARNMKYPYRLKVMPDGIWKVKWNPLMDDYLLVACMRTGFFAVDTEPQDTKVIMEYYEHEDDLAYGVDWMHSKITNTDQLISTCSFYNCKMTVAKMSL